MLSFVVGTALAAGLGAVARTGILSPYLTTAASVLTATTLGFSLPATLFTTVATYLTSTFLAQSNSAGLTSEPTAVIYSSNPLDSLPEDYRQHLNIVCLVLKALGLGITLLTPIPSLPLFTGPLVFFLAAALSIYSNRASSTTSYPVLPSLVLLTVQSLLLSLPLYFISASGLNPILGLISAISIPTLLFASTRPEPLSPSFAAPTPFRFLFVAIAGAITLATPGFSLSSIVSALFPNEASRYHTLSFLEGVTEGWVLKSIFLNDISGKTPLGDILSARPFLLDNFASNPAILLAVTLGIAAAAALTVLALRRKPISIPISPTAMTLFALSAQSFVTIGLWTIPLLAVGVALHFLREAIAPYDYSVTPLSFLLPISLT